MGDTVLRRWCLILVPLVLVLFLSGCVSLDFEPPKLEVDFRMPPPRLAGETVELSISAKDNLGVSSIVVKAKDEVLWSAVPGRRDVELDASFPAPFGSVELVVEAKDEAGNVSTVALRRFTTLDGSPPTVDLSVSPSSPKPGDIVTVSVEATDAESGIESVEANVSGSKYTLASPCDSISFLAKAGVYNITATARDRAGNVGTAPSKLLRVFDPTDGTAPEVALIYPASVVPGSAFTLSVIATDTGGIDRIDLSGDLGSQSVKFTSGPAVVNRTFSFVVSTKGVRNFEVSVQDLAGNVSHRSGSVVVESNTPPSIELLVPEGRILEGDLVIFEASASDKNGIERVTFEVDGEEIASVRTPPYKAGWIAESGEHTVKAMAYDIYGATASAVRSLSVQNVDSTGPVILFSPMDVYPVDTESVLYARIYDNESPVVEVSFKASEDELSVSLMGDDLYAANWVPEEVATYTITVSATNDQGFNSQSMKKVKVLPQEIASAPRFTEIAVYPTLVAEGEIVRISGKIESTSPIEACNLYVDDVLRGSTTTSNGRFDFAWVAVGLGEHVIKLSAVNTLGLSSEATKLVTVYVERPVATITSPDVGETFRKMPDLKVELVAQVYDSNEPAEYWFSITGPKDIPKITPVVSGAGPYLFQASFQPEGAGYYNISFFYKNSVELTTIATTLIRVYQLTLELEEPVSYEHIEFGHDVPVKVLASVDVETSTITVIDDAVNEKTYTVELTLSSADLTGKIFTATVPASAFPRVGPYTFRVQGATVEGDVQSEEFPRSVLDTTPPELTVTIDATPVLEGSYHKLLAFNDYTLSVSASDLASINKIEVDVGDDTTVVEGGVANVIVNLSKAVYPTRVSVVDGNGLSTELEFTMEGIERNPPYLTLSRFVFTPNATVFNVGDTVDVDAQSVEAMDDTAIASVALFANGQLIALWEPSLPGEELHAKIAHVQGPWTPDLVGNYTISLKCFDVYGNVASTSTVVQVADLSAPLVYVLPQTDRYVDGYPVLDGRMNVKVSFSDPFFAFEEAALYFDGLLLAYSNDISGDEYTFEYIYFSEYNDGFHTLSAVATNSAGSAGRHDLTVIVDNEAPIDVHLSLTGVATYLISGLTSTPVVSTVYSVRATPAGVDLPSDVKSLSVSFDSSVYQNLGKEAPPPYIVAFDPSSATDGVHIIEVAFTDMANNVATSSIVVLQDTTGPSVQWASSAGFNCVDGVVYSNHGEIDVKISDALTDVDQTKARVTSDGWSYSVYLDVTEVAAGTYRLSYGGVDGIVENQVYQVTLEMKDIAANLSEESFQLVYDTLSPTVTITSPSSGDVFNTDFTAVIHLQDNLAGLDGCYFATNGSATSVSLDGTLNKEVAFSVSVIPSTETTMTLSARASDLAMNLSSDTVVVRNDTLAPRLDLSVGPLNAEGYASTSTLLVVATAVDTWHGQVALSLDATSYALSTDTSVAVTGTSFTSVGDGMHTITIAATDEAGNASVMSKNATVDTTLPELFATWTPTEYASNGIHLDYVATDVNFKEVLFDWEDGSSTFTESSASDVFASFSSEGTKRIEVVARDLADNSASVTGTLVVDQTAPTEVSLWINGSKLTGVSTEGSVTFQASLLFLEPHFNTDSTSTLINVTYDVSTPVTAGTPIDFWVDASGTNWLLEASDTFATVGTYYVRFSIKDLAYNEYERTIEYVATSTSP
ncbi:MAG: hypothetical protein J7J80_02790 [Thermotogae bacterium]|nr:hypothetical protein [Thermotogota bacterium]